MLRDAVDEYLGCGDLHEGFARVHCPDCGHNIFVAFSCKQRCICPSCHQKRSLVTAINIAEHIAAPVAHRHIADDDTDTPYRKLCRGVGRLIKRVYEVDPLICSECGGTMSIVSFIERTDQSDVIERV